MQVSINSIVTIATLDVYVWFMVTMVTLNDED